VKEYTIQRKSKREREAIANSLLSRVLSSATFAEKVEAIKAVNPFFYLLTEPTKPNNVRSIKEKK
jgi:hypothetical protein